MKAFVIKNKEGEYFVGYDLLINENIFTNDIDNVDLKELEKFGFREDVENEWVKDYIDNKNFFIKYLDEFENEFIFVDIDTREINLCSDVKYYDYAYSNALSTIFDLIQAGLVENVVEDE